MEGIERVLKKLAANDKGQLAGFDLYRIRSSWKKIVGERSASHCAPVKLENRKLLVECDSSVWMNQLNFLKAEIVKKINEGSGKNKVSDIRFIFGEGFKRKRADAPKKVRTRKISLPDLTDEEKKAVEEKCSFIKNEKLRQKMIAKETRNIALKRLFNAGRIKKCPVCGCYIDKKEDLCQTCSLKKKKELEIKVYQALFKEPWLRYASLCGIVKCDEMTYNNVISEMKSYYFDKVRRKAATFEEEKKSVELLLHKKASDMKETEYQLALNVLKNGRIGDVRPSGE